MTWLALDIGGANLKSADGRGYAAVRSFPLWRAPEQLAAELGEVIAAAPCCTKIAATMTGELADCFATTADGVAAIVAATTAAAAGRAVSIYSTQRKLLSPDDAVEAPMLVAASNWHALAAFAARYAHFHPAILVDIGSTTTDVIPLNENGSAAIGATDPERLLSSELVYTGVERTPVSALVRTLPWRGHHCPVAGELFATAADAHLLLGNLSEEPENCDTADGRGRTRAAAHQRLARMICADANTFSREDAHLAARAIVDNQIDIISTAIQRVAARMAAPPETLILSGHGEFLAEAAIPRLPWSNRLRGVLSLNAVLGPHISRCAPAHALAVLAENALPTRSASPLALERA